MKKWMHWICGILLLLLIPAVLRAADVLPLGTRELIAEKYAGFSGVLRVWICEGWTSGESFSGWLNECFAPFERAHEGVYVEAIYVDESALATLADSGVRPPDAILFAPGMPIDSSALAALDGMPVRSALQTCGGGLAVPVALGGYAWATDTALPADRRELAASVPDDEPYRSWPAAMLALCSFEAAEEEIVDPGIDLGLPAAADALEDGEAMIEPVTQREIAQLVRLRDQGRGTNWEIDGAAAFTDQVLLMSVVANGGERQALAEELVRHLLGEESQSALADRGMFNTIDALTGYAANSPYLPIDLALHAESLIVPPAFSNAWRAQAASALGAYLSGEGEADALLRGLFGISE